MEETAPGCSRSPFDDVELRCELLTRPNTIPGVELPEAKLGLRPSFPLGVLRGEGAERFREVLRWFVHQVAPHVAQGG